MFRKYIFFGLMIMLGAVLISMIMKSRNAAPKPTSRTIELVRDSKPTATRVISPPDLQVESTFRLSAGKPSSRLQTSPQVVIRNAGPVPYTNMLLQFSCLDRGDAVVLSKTHLVSETVEPGKSVTLDDLDLGSLPAKTVRCSARVVHADLAQVAR